ncbi:MAG: peptidase S8 [Candidatus Eremiobacteraeota bacterium]|nr:peptidase S8 [Candidatus Eremiobacteraeota bacterium]
MNGPLRLAVPLLAALAIAACSGGSSGVPSAGGQSVAPQAGVQLHPIADWQIKNQARAICPQVVGQPTCLALTTKGIRPACTGSQCGWAPIDLETRYRLPISKGSGQIVAIVDAGDNPNAATDIATYRSEFGLGTANFTKYNQNGQQSNYPSYTGWSVEIDLDIEMVSAACPKCTIYLVEGNSSSSSDLSTAEQTAQNLGAHIISNSWICYGGSSGCGLTGFDTQGVLYLAASGDASYNNIGPPSTFPTVVAVGGSQLAKSGSTYSETVWNGAGSGCTTSQTKPNWQGDPGCTWRTDADVSSEAGCSPPVSEYDSYDGGWFGVCGTSAASPTIAAVYALAGNASSQDAAKALWKLKAWARRHELHEITSGNNGSCSPTYLCTAGTHEYKTYAGPTGWGTPNGIDAF